MGVSKRQRNRDYKKKKMNWPETRSGWIRRWKNSVKLLSDRATDLGDDREIYQTYLETILNNTRLDKSNEIFVLLEQMYLSHILVALRTFDDEDLRSHSLYNLIEEILDHPEVITRDWFITGFAKRMKCSTERDFVSTWRKGPHLSRRTLRADLSLIKRSCKKIRRVVNKYIAHNARRRQPAQLTFGEINTAMDNINEIVTRYYFLLCRARLHKLSSPSWTQVFDVPWNSQIS